MGSTGEADQKRREASSISPTQADARKQPFFPSSEEKKLETAVLQYQNQKLAQKLEFQKNERAVLEIKVSQLLEKQKPYETTLGVVQRLWEALLDDLEFSSNQIQNSVIKVEHCTPVSSLDDQLLHSMDDVFPNLITEVGRGEGSLVDNLDQLKDGNTWTRSKTMLCNLVTALNSLSSLEGKLLSSVHKALPEGSSTLESYAEFELELKNLQSALPGLHLRHTELVSELQRCCDSDAKNKADLKHLRGELMSASAELDTSNYELATLKTEKDETKGAFFPVLDVGSKHSVSVGKKLGKREDLQNMQSMYTELMDQAADRLQEIKLLHEEKMALLKQLADLQNRLKNVKNIWASNAYQWLKEQLVTSKSKMGHYLILFEKSQVEKDILLWRERDMNMETDLLGVYERYSSLADSRVIESEAELQKQIDEKNAIISKLGELPAVHGRKEIIENFKALVSSFPTEMQSMQLQVSKYKESSRDVHVLRADVQSLTDMVDRKGKELEILFARSSNQNFEIHKLQEMVKDLQQHEVELMLILEMLRRESFESKYIMEAKDLEYEAWAVVQSLASSLDENNLETRVKTAIEAEAMSQQKLAAAEAEIAELRQKLDVSRRDIPSLLDKLKSKNEEIEAYLSEIESIGQAYDDMQNQNQHLLQQIIERDDYNIKLYLEGARGRQMEESMLREKLLMDNRIDEANTCLKLFQLKAIKIDDHLKTCADHVQKLVTEKIQCSTNLECIEKKLGDVRRTSQQTKESLEDFQVKLDKSRLSYAELRIELEKERFGKKRTEEDLEIAKGRAARLKAQIDGSSVLQKLQTELSEYREILKCSICLERPKEVVITKCFHLFCNECVQKILDTRRRKCPTCSTSFGANDVKLVYI